MRDKASAAGREGAFTGQGWREGLGRQRFPVGAAVGSDDQLKQPFDRVAESNAVLLVPEGDGIKKGRRFGAFELQSPRLAAVDCFVNAGRVARADAEQIGSSLSKCLDSAEVEFFRAWNCSDRPCFAAVGGSRVGALCAADPCDLRTH